MSKHRLLLIVSAVSFVIALAPIASAADYYVDADRGDDRADGTVTHPVQTITRGLALVGPGETLHLASRSAPYRESIEVVNRSGEIERPIIIDGHGATLTGAEDLRVAEWHNDGDGRYHNAELWKRLRGKSKSLNLMFLLDRVFFRIGGRVQRMGRMSKGPQVAMKNSADLNVGEWSFTTGDETFHLRIEPDKQLGDAGIEFPIRESGVRIRGTCSDLVIRNVTVTHFWNDGFNIHNNCRRIRFENISAIENGDDGFSAHETCEVDVEGLRSQGNSTGVCNVNQSQCRMTNCRLGDNLAFEFFGCDGTSFHVTNMLVEAKRSLRPFVVLGNRKTGENCTIQLDNVQIVRPSDLKGQFEVAANGQLSATRITSIGLDWMVDGKTEIRNSLLICPRLGSQIKIRDAQTWVSQNNEYQFSTSSVADQTWRQSSFNDFLLAINDKSSRPAQHTQFDIGKLIDGTLARGTVGGAVLSEMRLPPGETPSE